MIFNFRRPSTGSGTTIVSCGGSASAITKFNISPAGNFAGRLKHLRIFNRASTESEVMALFAEAI